MAIYGQRKGGRTRQNDKGVQKEQPIRDGSLDRNDPTIPRDLRIVVIPRSQEQRGSCQRHDPGVREGQVTDYLNHSHYHVSSYLFSLYSSVVNPRTLPQYYSNTSSTARSILDILGYALTRPVYCLCSLTYLATGIQRSVSSHYPVYRP